jgi:hypothetical protein
MYPLPFFIHYLIIIETNSPITMLPSNSSCSATPVVARKRSLPTTTMASATPSRFQLDHQILDGSHQQVNHKY